MNPKQFVEQLKKSSFDNTFNPYAYPCPDHDKTNAPQMRAKILLSILEAALDRDIESIWIGQELGVHGGHRTGLAFTDDVNYKRHLKRWGLSCERPTQGKVVREQAASNVWEVLPQIQEDVFLWNVFPLFTHEQNNWHSNRGHDRRRDSSERKFGEEILSQLIHLLRPRRLIALGNVACDSTSRLGFKVNRVYYPSNYYKKRFQQQITELYTPANTS